MKAQCWCEIHRCFHPYHSNDHLEVSTSMALLIGWARRRLETQEELDLASLQKTSYEKP